MYKSSIADISLMLGMLLRPQQSVCMVAPGKDLYPGGQAVQTVAPLLFENVSATHVTQVVVAISDWNFPSSQLMHATEPSTLLYVPTAHATQGPVRSGPVKPGLHWYTRELLLNVEFFGMHGPPGRPSHHASHTQSVMF